MTSLLHDTATTSYAIHLESMTTTLTTAGLNRYALLQIYTFAGGTAASVSGGGTWVKIQQDTTNKNGEVWGCSLAAQQTSVTVTITFSTTINYCLAQIIPFYISAGTMPQLDASSMTIVSGASPSASLTTSMNNTDVIAFVSCSSNTGAPDVFAAGSGSTLLNSMSESAPYVAIGAEIWSTDVPASGTTITQGFTLTSTLGTPTAVLMILVSLTFSGPVCTQENFQIYNDDGTTINNESQYAGLLLTAAQNAATYDIEALAQKIGRAHV